MTGISGWAIFLNMKYTHLVMEENPQGRTLRVIFETDVESESLQVEAAARRIRHLTTNNPAAKFGLQQTRKGRKGNAVCVLSVNAESGSSLQAMDTFDTALELSEILGYTYNAVALALTAASKKQETSATLKGVEFCLSENIPGARSV